MRFDAFIGPTYQLKSVNVESQRCINLFPELVESGRGKEGAQYYLRSTPGLEKLFTIGNGPIRLVHVDDPKLDPLNPTNRVFVASGSELWMCIYSPSTLTWSTTKLGNLSTSSGPMRAASQQIDLGVTIFCDGIANYVFYRSASGGGFVTQNWGGFGSYGYIGVPTATHVVWLDSYLIFNEKGTNRFWVSDWASIAVDPLSFSSAEGDPDGIVGMATIHRDLYLFNERSTEVFSNTGNADFPFERVQGGYIEKGCLAPYSIAKGEGLIFWLGRDELGHGQVYAIEGLAPKRISTHAVEQAISGYANAAGATGYTYAKEGHSFYVLNFAEATWVYDLSTGLWHERAYNNLGNLERHRIDSLQYFPYGGFHIGGDYGNGKVYKLSDNAKYDDDAEIVRIRATPHVSQNLKRLFHASLTIDMEMGVGYETTPNYNPPKAMLQFSDDGGRSWSNEIQASIGAFGEYKTRLIFRRLGSSRDRVYKLKITDPVKVNIIGAELEIEGGNS